jgi:hypothetical protein
MYWLGGMVSQIAFTGLGGCDISGYFEGDKGDKKEYISITTLDNFIDQSS